MLGGAQQGNPGTLRGQSLIWEPQVPRVWGVPPRAGVELCQPSSAGSSPQLPACRSGAAASKRWGRRVLPIVAHTARGTTFLLQPSRERVAITSLNCNFIGIPMAPAVSCLKSLPFLCWKLGCVFLTLFKEDAENT